MRFDEILSKLGVQPRQLTIKIDVQKKTWIDKRDQDLEPEIKFGPDNWNESMGGGGTQMLISTPKMIDETIRHIPSGMLVTMSGLRDSLATQAGADYTCPMTTGIFLRIAAEAAEMERDLGKEDLAPWWRVIRDDGTMNEKMPGKGSLQEKMLTEEGHLLGPKPRGTKIMVLDFEPKVIQI